MSNVETARVTSSYVHVQRALDLLGKRYFGRVQAPVDHIGRGAFFSDLTEAVVAYLVSNDVSTLGQLLLAGDLEVGTVFSHTGTFFCRGVSQYLQKKRRAMPDAYSKLDDFRLGLRLEVSINPEHLTSSSAPDHVSGQRRLFLAGIISNVANDIIEARPVLIGLVIPGGGFTEGADLGFHGLHSGEVFLSQMDQFAAAAAAYAATDKELARLEYTSEDSIKHAFAEVIGEPFVPKDRGDEMSDLTTTNLSVEGKRVTSAFAFKGPAKFHPLTVKDMGKNGDQIFRLFNEPADLVVVQHCHQITSAVRAHMRAFATQPGRVRMFALINGADTCRILRTYQKLGF